MAFENGDQMKDYLEDCLEKYKKDKTIFDKALTMVDFYMKRSDWPNCIEELDLKSQEIVGCSIIALTWGVGKYINNPHMKWDDISEDFKQNYIYFYNCIGEIYNQYWHGRFYPNELNSVSYTQTGNNIYYIRFSKNNGEKIDLEMNNHGLSNLISSLSNIYDKENGNG